jgi:diguanylate cyclase (GGDEF)-like protein
LGSDTGAALDDLREKFIRNSAGRLDDLTALVNLLAANPADRSALDETMRKLHGLAGLGGTFGFNSVTTIGRQAESECQAALAEASPAPTDLIDRLRDAITALRLEFASGGMAAPEISTGVPPTEAHVDIVLLEDEPIAHEMLLRVLQKQGYRVRSAHTKCEALQLIEEKLPDALVSDILVPDGSGYDVVSALRARAGGEAPPVIVTSAVQGFLDRVEAVHRGADAFFEKPIDFAALVRTLENLLDRTRESTPRVLLVARQDADTEFEESVFGSAGYNLRVSREPRRFDAELSTFRPDLVLLSAHLDDASASDLTRWVRQKQGMTTVPVVVVGGDGSGETRVQCVRAGAEDWLPDGVAPGLLLATVAARIERARYVCNLLEHDGLTGLLTHSAFIDQLHRVWHECQRQTRRSPSLILIDIDHFKLVNDSYGHPIGDRVLAAIGVLLRRKLRRSDTIARYGGEEFAVLLDDLAAPDAVRLIERVRTEAAALQHFDEGGQPFHVTFSAGVASVPDGATEPEAWTSAADRALYAAKNQGRNCVVTAQ